MLTKEQSVDFLTKQIFEQLIEEAKKHQKSWLNNFRSSDINIRNLS